MNAAFLRFNESALKSGLFQFNPTLGRELKQTTETFVTLARSAADQGPDEEEEVGEGTLDIAAEMRDATRAIRGSTDEQLTPNPPPESQHTSIGWGYTSTLESSLPTKYTPSSRNDPLSQSSFFQQSYDESNQLNLVRSKPKSMFYGATVGQVIDPASSQSPDGGSPHEQPLPFGLVDFNFRDRRPYSPPTDNPQIYSVDIPSPIHTPKFAKPHTPPLLPSLSMKTPKPSWTYSHDETTFARRLTRASLEAGFHLLSGANLRPAAVNYVFRLSLPYCSLEELRERFKIILARSTEEELDCFDTPFIHLGGAGTHYPRKDARGNTIAKPNSWNIRSIGPLRAKLARAENLTDPSQSHDLDIDLTGFEGEWFDPDDIEGYLAEEKSCHIDPKASFAECLIDVEDGQEPETPEFGFLSFSKKMSLDFSGLPSDNPGLSSGSSSEPSSSNKSTPGSTVGELDAIIGKPDPPFGLDMNAGGFDFTKYNGIDHSSLYDQPLGLDLAPGFDANLNTAMTGLSATTFSDMSNLGLDLMGGGIQQLPVAKPKQKKVAWIDVTKFINGEFSSETITTGPR